MVWTPDALVIEFCTRDTSPDASNRARYHCNACSHVFPLGSVRDMREHLITCPSLGQSTIDRITTYIRTEASTPKRVTRDPRWTKEQERTLLRLDGELDASKTGQRYKKMAAQIGRSAQACRQKLLHLKEAETANKTEKKLVKRVAIRSGGRKVVDEDYDEDIIFEDDDEDTIRARDIDEEELTDDDEHVPSAQTVRRVNRQLQGLRPIKTGNSSPPPLPRPNSNSTTSDFKVPASRMPIFRALRNGQSETVQRFLHFVRMALHHALENDNVFKSFYDSGWSIEMGWSVFVRSGISHEEKDEVVVSLIGLWLDGLDSEGFEVEVDQVIEKVILELSEWTFANGSQEYCNTVKSRDGNADDNIEETDSGYGADTRYEGEDGDKDTDL